jgi:phage terminase small subunit
LFDGRLFTRDFLLEGIRETTVWAELDAETVEHFWRQAKSLLEALAARKNPNEAQTEDDLVYPLLEMVDWVDREVQPNASVKARLDVPDALLYPTGEAKTIAGNLDAWDRFQHGQCIVEAKRWDRALDRETRGRKGEEGTPSSQILRYLRRVEERTRGKLRWGILTNGRVWRLYFHGAVSIAEDFLEIDLGKVLDIPGCDFDLLDKRPELFADDHAWRDHVFRLFILLFGRNSFLPNEHGESFHQLALREGKRWEAKVARTLSNKVFDEVFPSLADGMARHDPLRPKELTTEYLDEVREAALILLYRLLFVLYAEDRNLLPDEQGPYAPYCLTRIRLDIAEQERTGAVIPQGVITFWPRIMTIFSAISHGNDDLGIPPYNGGLFDPNIAPILTRVQLPDRELAKIIFGLSHEPADGSRRGPRYINYRDLSVQQLGAVYERILEYGIRTTGDGGIEVDADDEARHKSGSYYTPEELVSLIINRAVGPLVDDRIAAFRGKIEELFGDRRPKTEKLAILEQHDPATAILSLKICDPAMGSGHFLVSLVDWLSDRVLDAVEEAASLVEGYASPLVARVEAVRDKILLEAREHKWPLVEAQLDDRHIVRRMVLKRTVYGVDKNPMAVELAKVALWLHSFTAGAPLSFLDHHLRAGDSVIGAFVRPSLDFLADQGALFNRGQITSIENVSGLMAEIEETTDNDIAEAHASKEKFGTVEEVIDPVATLFSLLTAERLMGVFEDAPKKAPDLRKMAGKSEKQIARAKADQEAFDRAAAFRLVLDGTFGDPIRIASGDEQIASEELKEQLSLIPDNAPEQNSLFPGIAADDRRRVIADALVRKARSLAHQHGFFHWEIAFPSVWSDLTSASPRGGFDAVIGNPPYVRQELLGTDVKRALKDSYKTFSGMADLFVFFYEQGLRILKPGGRMSYVVTNKWLKAGYAEALRGLFTEDNWLEFIADFGHAKHFFADADVFPSVIVVKKPLLGQDAPGAADVCVIPRDEVPRKGLEAAVEAATFPLSRLSFTREAWVLEPKPVMDLLDKIRGNGVPLAEYAGIEPLYGIKTGLNEAFLIDSFKRDELVRADPKSSEIIKPYLRGQDIERWHSPDSGLYMIVLRSSGNYDWPWADASDESEAEKTFAVTYPALYAHMKSYEDMGKNPKTGKPRGLRYREDQGRFWWELRACDYYDAFEAPKISYQVIQFYPKYALDTASQYGNDKTFFLPSDGSPLLSTLNSPIMWWHNWRFLQHLKDEALSPMAYRVEKLPIPSFSDAAECEVSSKTADLVEKTKSIQLTTSAIQDWLRLEFGLEKLGTTLGTPHLLDADAFISAVRKVLPKSKKLSAADIQRLKQEHLDTIQPARDAATQALALEHKLSDLVNAAYGLTPEEVKLMWDTAPPRMPFLPR